MSFKYEIRQNFWIQPDPDASNIPVPQDPLIELFLQNYSTLFYQLCARLMYLSR